MKRNSLNLIVLTIFLSHMTGNCLPVSSDDQLEETVQLEALMARDVPKAHDFVGDAKSSDDRNENKTPESERNVDTKESVAGEAEQELSDVMKRQSSVSTLSSVTMYNCSTGSSITATVQNNCVAAHNFLRSLHSSTGTVTWDATLASGSATWAAYLAGLGSLVHSSGSYGENLYRSSNSYGAKGSCAHACKAWYGESSPSYDYTSNTFVSSKGHFTQLVWSASLTIGCGVATNVTADASGYTFTNTYVVCRYVNQGNVVGSFTTNVKPLKSGASVFVVPSVSYLVTGSTTNLVIFAPKSTCVAYSPTYCSTVKADCECQCP